jgi:hypothetical protein
LVIAQRIFLTPVKQFLSDLHPDSSHKIVWRIGAHSLAPHHKTFNDQALEERGTSNPLALIQLIAFGSADLSGAVWAAQETPHPISNQPSDYNHLILN